MGILRLVEETVLKDIRSLFKLKEELYYTPSKNL